MRFKVECYENQSLFNPEVPDRPWSVTREQVPWALAQPMLLVAVLSIEAENSATVPDEAFALANAPWNPTDADGFAWPHDRVRSMCSGDVVVVHTPDGMVANVCLNMGWERSEPHRLRMLTA